MSMRKSTRQELRKSRELLRFFLRDKNCYICDTPLLAKSDRDSYAKDGDGQASPITEMPTIHHIDLDHDNDKQGNKAPVHDVCHRSFHLTLRHAMRNEKFHGKKNIVEYVLAKVRRKMAGK
jgi:hypothetical protein